MRIIIECVYISFEELISLLTVLSCPMPINIVDDSSGFGNIILFTETAHIRNEYLRYSKYRRSFSECSEGWLEDVQGYLKSKTGDAYKYAIKCVYQDDKDIDATKLYIPPNVPSVTNFGDFCKAMGINYKGNSYSTEAIVNSDNNYG